MTDIPDETVRAESEMLLSHPLHFPDEFKRWLGDFVATNIPMIPFSHIFGARQNTARSGVYIPTSETTAVTAYTNLATVGPEITLIADGTYLVMYGATCRARCSISVNGAVPVDDDSIWGEEQGPAAGRMKIISLKNNNQNTLRLQYKSGTFSHRWLVIMRLGSPGES
jgi:hypothetical protein